LKGSDSRPISFNPYPERHNCGSHGGVCPGRGTVDVDVDHNDKDKDNEDRCRNCNSATIFTDWKQGDRVCTSCGVVAEERMMDDRPEWKDFNDAEDIIKGMPSGARSGLVAVDESKYVGGLQPTILSKDAFGTNSGGFKMTKIRRQLKTTNKRLDHYMEKAHKRALQDARLERRVRLKREKEKQSGDDSGTGTGEDGSEFDDTHPEVRPEFDMVVLQEEQDMNRLQAAIYADKWSLDRAIFLHGDSTDASHRERAMSDLHVGESREDLLSHMDKTVKDASRDLYNAYSMIIEATTKLDLPHRVVNESTHRLVRYATRRDGLPVKGVSSRLPKENGKEDNKEARKIAATRLREYNKMKQVCSLGAAILFLTARSLGWTRTVLEICDCFHPSLEHSTETISIKAKHCFRAINEIKTYFPEYARTPAVSAAEDSRSAESDCVSASNFADHFVRNLQLPPVAEASIRALLVHCRHEQMQLGRNSGVKMSTLCAAVVYFVCTAGAAMQKVAKQSHAKTKTKTKKNSTAKPRGPMPMESSSSSTAKKKRAAELPKKEGGGHEKPRDSMMIAGSSKDSNSDSDEESKINNDDAEPFDVFTHAPIVDNQAEKLEYEMRRMWDAWAEQMAWSRSLHEIEQACSISSNSILNLYKSDMYPRRKGLLDVLNAAVSTEHVSKSQSTFGSHSLLSQTPMASILLAHISTAGVLMSSK